MQTTTTTTAAASNEESATATTTTRRAASNELRNQLLQFTCGAMAGISSKTAVAPLERLKTIYQVHTHGRVPSLREGVRLMWYDGGIYGLFRGNLANCIKSAPSASLKLYLFEKTKRLFATTDDQLDATQLFVSGAVGGCLSHCIVYPLDVIRTRLSATAMGTYHGILDCLFQMYTKEGVSSLYKGLSASLSSTLPSSGISLVCVIVCLFICFSYFFSSSLPLIYDPNNDYILSQPLYICVYIYIYMEQLFIYL
jgi:hypothetical protein